MLKIKSSPLVRLALLTVAAWMGSLIFSTGAIAQAPSVESSLEKLMVRYEAKVLRVYQEMQSLDDSPLALQERVAFDSLLSAYTSRVLEMYKTLARIKSFTLENYRVIAARALIFRALAFIENSEAGSTSLSRACDDYRTAQLLTKGSKIPVINKPLPYEVWIGDRLYTRLADLLDDKDRNLKLLRCMQSAGTNE